MDPITGLAVGRISIGAIALVSPKLAAKMFLLDPQGNPQLGLMTRLFASREIALGAITLATTGTARRALVQVGVAVDGADVLAGLAATATGAVPKTTGLLFTAVAAGALAAGATSLQ